MEELLRPILKLLDPEFTWIDTDGIMWAREDALRAGLKQLVPSGADVQITGSASTGSPGPGQPFSYTFQIKDNGPDTAGAVIFGDMLPAGTVYRYATVNGFSRSGSSAPVSSSTAATVS